MTKRPRREKEKGFLAKKWISALLCVLTAAVLSGCVFAPSASIALLPIACLLAYYLSVSWGAWFLVCAAAFHLGLSALLRGLTPFAAAGTALLLILLLPRLLRKKLSLLWEAALCAGVGIASVCAVYGVWALATHQTVTGVLFDFYANLTTDPIAVAVGERYYRKLTIDALGHAHLPRADEGYYADVMQAYAAYVARESDGNLLWYLSGFGAFAGGVACVGAAAVAQARREGAARVKLQDVRLGKNYLLAVVLPVLLFALTAFYAPMQPMVRAVVNVAVTLPTTLCGITLLYHTCVRARGKARIATVIAFWAVLLVAAVFYEWGLLILGFIGLADAILNVRKWLDWALQ